MKFELAVETVMSMLNGLMALLPNILVSIIVFTIFWFGSRVINSFVHRFFSRDSQNRHLALVLARISSALVIFAGVMVSSAILFPSVTPADLLGLLGIGGVAIGFAFKDIFQNLLAGVLILLMRPFKEGDQIELGDHEGTVEDIQVRATIIRTYDNRKVIIPNSDIYTGKVIVNTAYPKRRLSVEVGIGNGDDVAKAKKIIQEELAQIPAVLHDPSPKVLIREYGASSVNLEVRFWLSPPRRLDAVELRDAVLERLKPALVKQGIDLPYATYQVLFHDQTEETDGVRSAQREGWPSGNKDPRARWQVVRDDAKKRENTDDQNNEQNNTSKTNQTLLTPLGEQI